MTALDAAKANADRIGRDVRVGSGAAVEIRLREIPVHLQQQTREQPRASSAPGQKGGLRQSMARIGSR